LDTTYFLPTVGIAIRNIPRTIVRDLQREGHSISICSITIFELAAKGAKFVQSGKIGEARVREGLRAILGDGSIVQVDFREPEILTHATALRADVNDFIDCLIVASGAGTCDALVSEDEELQEIVSRDEVRHKLSPINPGFKVSKARRT
jgi:hypothetical protein